MVRSGVRWWGAAGLAAPVHQPRRSADERLVRIGSYSREESHAPAAELLSLPDRPTAIFAANDLSALGIIDVARQMDIEVPRDLSVVGFDDIPDSAQSTPPLTTVQQPLQRMGAEAVRLLLALLDCPEPEARHVRLPVSLVRRGSSAHL